jgi:lipoprotein-anchoring transpeptidase ErfK/SrfK
MIFITGCSTPPIPPEVQEAAKQDIYLWRLGVPQYLPKEYARYKEASQKAREDLIRENSRFSWFRDYSGIRLEFRNLLNSGNQMLSLFGKKKQEASVNAAEKISFFRNRINTLKGLTTFINEGRLARKDIIKAEVLLLEAQNRYDMDDFIAVEGKINEVAVHLNAAEHLLFPILSRYGDKDQVRTWQQWINDTVTESGKRKILVIIVDKSKRTLTVYRSGIPYKTYQIGIGKNGSSDKLHAGDYATPEGKYKIVEKVPNSRYHKALLINYPNEKNRNQYLLAKKKGLIPQYADIGGLIEIHGGGKDIMTYGCISMDNQSIDELYTTVKVGTPVTIIGAVDIQNRLSSALQGSKQQ